MKKFIRNLLIFTIIIAVITVFVNSAYVKLNKSDPDYIKKFLDIPETLDICNFGSSHGLYGYDYEEIKKEYNCFNFALVSQSLTYDYRLFQYYGDHIDEGTVVFINISYFSLFGKGEVNGNDFESKNKRYYSILPPSLIKEYDVNTNIFVRYLPALYTDIGTLAQTLLGKSEDTNDQYWEKVAFDIDVMEDAQEAFDRHMKNKYDDAGNIIMNQEEVDALYSLIEGCQEKGAIPILITTPYLAEYTDAVNKGTPDFYEQFYSVVDQVAADTGVEYYDYAFDERFSNNYAWFMNSDHLNREGARNFVNILMQEVVYEKGYK